TADPAIRDGDARDYSAGRRGARDAEAERSSVAVRQAEALTSAGLAAARVADFHQPERTSRDSGLFDVCAQACVDLCGAFGGACPSGQGRCGGEWVAVRCDTARAQLARRLEQEAARR